MALQRLWIILVIVILNGCSTGYKNNGKAVYYQYWNEGSGSHEVKLHADPNTFKILQHDRYAKDKTNVFYEGEIVEGADATTFETLDDWYAKDKYTGYYGKNLIKSSNGKTFKVIDDYYSTDGQDVFYDTLPLRVCSCRNFKIVYADGPYEWSTDGCHYYYMNSKVPSEDYLNVKIYRGSGGLSKDKKYVYFLDHKLNYDIDGKKVVDTIDAESFNVTSFLECSDKWGCFNPYHGRQRCEK